MYNQMIIAFPYSLRRHVEDGRRHLTTIHRILLLLGEVNQQQPTAAGTAREGLPAGARLCYEVLKQEHTRLRTMTKCFATAF